MVRVVFIVRPHVLPNPTNAVSLSHFIYHGFPPSQPLFTADHWRPNRVRICRTIGAKLPVITALVICSALRR